MSSVASVKDIARDLGGMLAPHEGWQRQVTAIHRELTSQRFEWRIPDLSWSRVKSWFYGEARRVDYEHMVALKELKALLEARRARIDIAATANRLAALVAAQKTALAGDEMRSLGRLAGELDRAGITPGSGGEVQ